jgi:hypothetical protein
VNKIEDAEWDMSETASGEVLLVVKHADGKTETVHVAGLPEDSERNEMIYRTAQSVIIHHHYGHRVVYSMPTRDEAAKINAKEEETMAPPPLAELIISCLAPENTAQAQLGDLHEMFESNVARLGERQARRKYWMQVASSLLPLLWQWIKRIGLITMLVDYLRSKIGL